MEVSVTDNGADFYHLIKTSESYYIVFEKKKYRAYNHDEKISFFVIASENDQTPCTLLVQEKVLFKEEIKAENSFLSDTPANFRRIKDQYFLKFGVQGIVAIPKKTKDFIPLFPAHNSLIKKYISSHKLKTKNPKDVLEIVRYYNSLMKN